MDGQIVIQSSPEDISRRKPLLPPRRDKKRIVGECAGSTAAECAAVCCCCPFVVAEVLVIAVYKLPTAICRRIWRKMFLRKKLNNNSGRMSTIHSFNGELDVDRKASETVKVSTDGSAEAIDLDGEMWERFHNTGFGRSLSQRHVW